MSPRVLPLVAFGLALGVLGLAFALAVLLSRPASVDIAARPVASRPVAGPSALRPASVLPTEPVPPPRPTSCAALRLVAPSPGAPLLLSGFVQRVSRAGFSERQFWGIPDGVSYACIADADHEDLAGAVLLFDGAPPSWHRGEQVTVSGKYRGTASVPGTPLLDGCVVVKELPLPERHHAR